MAMNAKTEASMNAYKIAHRGFEIVLKKDFGDGWHLIDGMPCRWGYVVCYAHGSEYLGCNALPGATWAQTVAEAKEMIDVFLALAPSGKEEDLDSDVFWTTLDDVRKAKAAAVKVVLLRAIAARIA